MSKKTATDCQLELPLSATPCRWENVLNGIREEIADHLAVLILDWEKMQQANSIRPGGHNE